MSYMTIACFHYSLPQKQSQRVGAIFHILHANEGLPSSACRPPSHWHAEYFVFILKLSVVSVVNFYILQASAFDTAPQTPDVSQAPKLASCW